jgi:hypothetical protein
MKTARYTAFMVAAIVVGALLMAFATSGSAQTATRSEENGFPVDPQTAPEPTEGQPPIAITVTLSVYSGRHNPTWTLEPSPDFDRLVALLKGVKTSGERLFNYLEWNRLGYASFWVVSRGVPGLPGELHVWRDMAYVPTEDGKGLQAVGASELYEFLVSQAERRDFREFFLNYRKQHPRPGKAQ